MCDYNSNSARPCSRHAQSWQQSSCVPCAPEQVDSCLGLRSPVLTGHEICQSRVYRLLVSANRLDMQRVAAPPASAEGSPCDDLAFSWRASLVSQNRLRGTATDCEAPPPTTEAPPPTPRHARRP
eukprot:scaffold15665_cov70-Phaeocystis_antarctica.AAC.3